MTHNKYLLYFFIIFSIFFFLIVSINLYLNYKELESGNDKNELAAAWQEKTRGISCVSDSTNRVFKNHRINKLIKKDVNTIVLGSSTVMGIKADMFPKTYNIYNFAQNSNPTTAILAELELLKDKGNLSHFIVSLDWALGFLTEPSWEIPTLSLDVAQTKKPSLHKLIKDSMSAKKVKVLLDNLKTISFSNDRTSTFKKVFHLLEEEYSCKDGNIARDFNSNYPGKCAGFNYDGSTNFALYDPLDEAQGPVLIQKALLNDSRYIKDLNASRGNVRPNIVTQFAALIKVMKTKQRDIFFILPPLIPGLEKEILRTKAGNYLLQIKKTLHRFALENEVQILDAGQSEDYGCTVSEFLDCHHAFPVCYQKILSHFFAQRDKLGYGLLSSSQLNAP